MNSGPMALPKAVKAFDQWRSTREKQSKIPDYLWDLALPLLSNHQESVVLCRLGLSTNQLRNKLKSRPKDDNSTQYQPITAKPCEFIECDLKINKIQ